VRVGIDDGWNGFLLRYGEGAVVLVVIVDGRVFRNYRFMKLLGLAVS